MTTDTKMTGGCMCGSVRFETTGETFGMNYYHCNSCRKYTGGPVVTLAGFMADQVKFSGYTLKIYASPEGVGRAFCGNCGTPLTW
ncbi:MAG: GFA family protein, partial [Paracoccaceae bacterium]